MIRVQSTSLTGVKLIQLECFDDHRGDYVETYNEEVYRKASIDVTFIQDDYSCSVKHVLRGIHGDGHTWKLITCPYGKLYLVVVNCDKQSKEFGKWESFVLSDKNNRQVLIPPKYGNGHLILSEMAIFSYKQSSFYDSGSQFSYRWDDQRFGIWWPVSHPILSQRDTFGRYV